jgi:hypothetical protein
MLKLMRLLEIAPWRSIWLCQNLSGSVMKFFVSTITFFKTYTQVTSVKNCKLDEIGVKVSLVVIANEALHNIEFRAK